ncbi:uncharacterized protein rnf180a [Pholidichthys leucotaenia]
MSVGASGVNISASVSSGAEEDSEENGSNDIYTLVRPALKSADPAGGGRWCSGEQLVRPAQSERRIRRDTSSTDKMGRGGEENQDREEEVLRGEHSGCRNRRKQRHRRTDRAETHGDGAQCVTEIWSSSNSSHQLNNVLEDDERSSTCHRGHTSCPGQDFSCVHTVTANLNSQSSQTAVHTRSISQSPQQTPSRPAAGDFQHYSVNSFGELDPFWVEVRTGHRYSPTHVPNLALAEHGEEEEEEEEEEDERGEENTEDRGRGVMEVMSHTMTSTAGLACIPFVERRMSKREKNRIKSLRRWQRRREKWRQSHQQESRQSSTGYLSSSGSKSSSEDEEAPNAGDRDGFICAVCLDVYFSPYMCHPCSHIFCEPCLRTLAKNCPTNTPCPLCRTVITHVFFQKELNQTARTFFPKEYLSRKQNFQKASCAKWPLPSCRKLFRIFGGFQRQSSPVARHQFPHGRGYRLGFMDFEDDSQGWRFDMDMVIIYIYSVNWVIGFLVVCFLCYFFFPSF